MSKLGAYRIVNLTYNGNSQNAVIKVIDETFESSSKVSSITFITVTVKMP